MPADFGRPGLENNVGCQTLLALVESSARRLTAAALINLAARTCGCRPRQARTLLRRLVDAGQLAFYPEGGGSFVDLSFDRCVSIGQRLAVCPADKPPDPGKVAIRLHRGAAFGCGRHPSTRLALRGIEAVFNGPALEIEGLRLLDIGTGSGVLAIAGLLLGAAEARAIDIDPVSLTEARANLALNGLAAKAVVDDTPLAGITGLFDLITANLRYPTLCRIAPHIGRLTAPAGRSVFSGFRPEEAPAILDACAKESLRCCWQATEKGWMALGMVNGKGEQRQKKPAARLRQALK
jgi:ribosomal protein L11 methyltransferase